MSKIKDRVIGEYYSGISNEGLNVIYIPKVDFERSYGILTTNFGSVDNNFIIDDIETKLPDGIAHFLEHKMFEEENIDIFEEFSKIGASANAFTSFDQTSYLFSATKNFYKALQILVEYVQRPYFTEENVEKEMGIIEQEIKMYDDDINWRVFFNALDSMYFENPVRIDIAGTVDTIKEINVDILNKVYNSFYHNSNMVLVVVGDLNFDLIMETVNKFEKSFSKRADIKKVEFKEPVNVKNKEKIDYMETSTEYFAIGFKETDNGSKDKIKRDISTNILLDLLFSDSSEFFNELYSDGLISDSLTSYYTNSDSYGHSLVIGESQNSREIQKRILKLINSNFEELISEEDFIRIKNNREGRFLMGLDSVDLLARMATSFYFDNISFEKYFNIIDNINYEDIRDRYLHHLKEENMVISIVEPIKQN